MAAVIARPRRLNESIAAALGALAMLAFGVLRPDQALAALVSEWNLFLFFLGLMLISGLADAAGFVDAAGALAVAAARGSGRLLLLTVFVAGAVITTFLSNDATAGHSLRRGFATTAARRGVADRTIMRHTWHRSRTTLDAYIEEGTEFTDNAASYVGL